MAHPSEIVLVSVTPTEHPSTVVDGEVVAEHAFTPSNGTPISCSICGQDEQLHQNDGDDWEFDDEDFENALDLMETSYKILRRLMMTLDQEEDLRAIDNHCDDLNRFIGEFA